MTPEDQHRALAATSPETPGRRPLVWRLRAAIGHLGLPERILVGAGFVLLAVFAAAKTHQAVLSRTAVWSFERALASTRSAAAIGEVELSGRPEPSDPAHACDTSLWSAQRIRSYRESLAAQLDPPLAVLRIPKISLEVPVLHGTDELSLNRGVGHIQGTPLPGSSGNIGIAGHRDGFFRGLKDLAVGDHVELVTLAGRETYAVESIRIVPPEEVSVLDQTGHTAVTLVTCYPFYFVGHAPLRFIVRAGRVPSG